MPQLVPATFIVPSTHACAPVVQDVTPDAHALGLPVHDCPAVQATHVPLPSQTMPAPHDAPAVRLLKSSHTGVPVVQLVIPVLHGFGLVVQFVFAAQATHVPVALHTMLVPQLDPGPLLLFVSAQVGAPVVHDVVPALQGLGLVAHDWPAAQATHAPPPSQTWPTPQFVPALRFVPSPQLVVLPPQLVVPCLHAVGLPLQLWPATHAPQKPLPSHICPPVQGVVDDLGVPSTQTSAPVTHDVTPFRQIDGLVVHAVPAVHDTHTPLPLQTRLVPQVMPATVFPESRQRSAPVVQSMTPVLHGAPGLVVQALPA